MTPWMEPITDASAWTAEDLKRDESWKFTLTDDHRSDLDKALKQVNQSGLQFGEIKREDFSLPSFQETLQNMLNEICNGRGFAMLSGFLSEDYDFPNLEKLYWGAVHSFGHWSYAKQRSRPNSLCHRWPTTPSKRSVDSRQTQLQRFAR